MHSVTHSTIYIYKLRQFNKGSDAGGNEVSPRLNHRVEAAPDSFISGQLHVLQSQWSLALAAKQKKLAWRKQCDNPVRLKDTSAIEEEEAHYSIEAE